MNEKLQVNLNWTFKEIIIKVKALKQNYDDVLASFSYFDLHKKIEIMKKFRDSIYVLNFEEWKKDRLWDYLNDYLSYEELISIARK